ncbi:tyrosine-protein phosphatase non-receptor type 18-like isoform X1 [Acipenser ruthenus]|uniref:tyrosine-protein phosphatase non-receptor type 18-like isoform X1 n=1 Tax=Acipenser ruthenus TaxID=7906 RepID=UPI00274053A3|nr:tyrosine-protein phosphatase non-receptor type 18-like isoform X1 [Acipenser ruthenus]
MEEHLKSFLERVKSLQASNGDKDNGIATEFKRIRSQTLMNKQNKDLTTEAGGVKENTKKNRYKDILPYDQTRVTLLSDHGSSDYINASFIKGALENHCYIATQGPLSHTVVDLWRMIWQYKVKVCIMACREIELGKKKCERYWADHSETAIFGDFVITNLDESRSNEEVIIRMLSVQCQGEVRTLSHFQYTAWPDHGIPSDCDGILDMMEEVHSRQAGDTAPILIHCSAGCGRTGVICAVDYIRDLLLTERITASFSIWDIVLEIRKQRPSAVQTKEQYEFVYHTVAQMFQKALKCHGNSYENLNEDRVCLYDDVESLNQAKKPLSPSPTKTSKLQPSKPPLKPRPSLPSLHKNMSDTYAVVNKTKRRVPSDNPTAATISPTSPKTNHEYDNEEGVSKNRQPPDLDALYSRVKPKARFPSSPNEQAAPPVFPSVPVYEPTSSPPLKGVDASLQERGTYDNGSGRNSSCLGSLSHNHRKDGSLSSLSKKSAVSQSTDDNYEYVTGSSQGTPNCSKANGLGFNCRVGKPKGPRDPPFEWSREER